MVEVKETWTTDVKDPQIRGLKRPQGYRYHIQHKYDSRRDVLMHDLLPCRLIDSPDAICNRPKVKIMSNDTKFPSSTGMTRGSRIKNSREVGSSGF